MESEAIDEELRTLEFKLSQLKRDYDQFFLGTRPREPVVARGEVNKIVIRLTNTPLKNTAARFKFSSICSRFQAYRRQWDDTLRKIEAGTYERHQFKARLQGRRGAAPPAGGGSSAPEGEDLYQSYVDARLACGESVEGLSRQKLDRVIEKQRSELAAKFGGKSDFTFRVAVEGGKVRLKAARKKA